MINIITPPVKTIKTDKILLIDADFIKYYVIADMKKDKNNQKAFLYEDPIAHYTEAIIKDIQNEINAKGYLFCFSGHSTNVYRNNISLDKQYKGNRQYHLAYDGAEEDKIQVLTYIKSRYPALLFDDLEADDLLCMLQDEETIVYSHDKDLIQIPGSHYDIQEKELIEVTKSRAYRFLMYQLATGDSTDNIGGIDGFGEKSAVALDTIASQNLCFHIMDLYFKKDGLFEGLDKFVETYNLCKLRMKRGKHFISKYQHAFDTLQMLKLL